MKMGTQEVAENIIGIFCRIYRDSLALKIQNYMLYIKGQWNT